MCYRKYFLKVYCKRKVAILQYTKLDSQKKHRTYEGLRMQLSWQNAYPVHSKSWLQSSQPQKPNMVVHSWHLSTGDVEDWLNYTVSLRPSRAIVIPCLIKQK